MSCAAAAVAAVAAVWAYLLILMMRMMEGAKVKQKEAETDVVDSCCGS